VTAGRTEAGAGGAGAVAPARAGAPGHGMQVSVVSPERLLYEGAATAVVAPAYDGEVGILPRHAPFVTLLGAGELVIRSGAGARTFTVRGGFVEVSGNRVRIVVEQARVTPAGGSGSVS
jgi:F-type H+-transporting ATPase subunit epsilon